ncbi:MAG TPA: DUF1127 domain-containing protein [Acetobacteraceae bacterium]|jgi:uncharacterized protein YjiS (DUF1127 family)|nr:DUF1127 domain-containing protein [Acetobacteraceae bacterium]
MSAPLAKSDFVFKLSTSRSYIGSDYDPAQAEAQAPQAAPHGLGRAIADGLAFLVAGVRSWAGRQVTLAEMDSMSDRELADIGLTRSDLPRVFDADFVADHTRGRAAY